MNVSAEKITYGQTGYYSKIVIDYISEAPGLQPFYTHPVSLEGIKAAIHDRESFPTDRKLLHRTLLQQYAGLDMHAKVQANIDALLDENTFTVTTAHQPNIFTGHLYFIYKILHAVKLAETLKAEMPGKNFVPVFYMGSEDADLEELGHIYIDGEKYEWKTEQAGAVGRMTVDKALVQLIDTISGRLTVYPYGEEIIRLLKSCYQPGRTIEQATQQLVHTLFGSYGLVILLPDNAALKTAFIPVVKRELEERFSHKAVTETVAAFPKEYKVQASGRELNLFYLQDNSRERITEDEGKYFVNGSPLVFDKQAIMQELEQHPERFSANVILRPVFQEMILPNIAFIGGGGEIAYWLELKKVFEAVNVPYPVLVVRNSFMIVPAEAKTLAEKLGFTITDLFKDEEALLNEIVRKESTLQLDLGKEKEQLSHLYQQTGNVASAIDTTLQRHIEALHTQALKRLSALEKKMFRAQKKKFEAQQRQLHKLKAQLFPHNNLQERIENLLPFYAKRGMGFIDAVYRHSGGLEQEFAILVAQETTVA